MSAPEKSQVLGFKAYQPRQWPPHLSKMQKKFHEHTRCRGFTPDELARIKIYFKETKPEKKGPFVS